MLILRTLMTLAAADPNDWVYLEYLFDDSARSSPVTSDARQSIATGAHSTAQEGPWTVTHTQGMLPPNGNPHDYLSWAPYHWPYCNWCGGKTSRGADEFLFNETSDPEDGTSGNFSHSSMGDSSNGSYSFGQRNRLARVRRSGLSVDDIMGRAIPATSDDNGDKKPHKRTAAPKCTPSPTSQMPPSATWTTCPYIARDGKVNPDVTNLTGSKSMVHMSQAVLYGATASVLKEGDSAYSQQTAEFLYTFFLDPATAINPNVNFGQLVRGPGPQGQIGTFTGILDLRGMVKVVNAIAIMIYSRSPDWTRDKHSGMRQWMGKYQSWLQTSSLGKEVATKPNNHATFYFNQLAVSKVFMGDLGGAADVLQRYFNTTFLDQIAVSGEQPFEAVRTRPFHYRCFNLEAMITNAKLGDELGLNFWRAKSNYGATIQTAVDYAMAQDPKEEDITELAPHVAAVAAIYGDPIGKYAAFLQRSMPKYRSQPFWFYDQPKVPSNSPSSRLKSYTAADRDQSILWDIFGSPQLDQPSISPNVTNTGNSDSDPASLPSSSDTPAPPMSGTGSSPSMGSAGSPSTSMGGSSGYAPVRFECPTVFSLGQWVEIDDGVFVTCDELRPFYELPATPSVQY
ncbi:chondroitin AC/alginate lyase [Neolentinus lepideus HHB14362 ss-1]|uniref:Chondroitin AC/alginate lyase n=1 Tax=Neolentinus lepideus HHB14362 ss-1 TaxID=1314782 RepID=A0A165VXQ1_9AGAM|nr:chondroitin AC/alginate lyase [Neolentinus lepideus HHB14362 ss-1]